MNENRLYINGSAGETFSPVDLLVVGAGPIGLACALEAQRAGLSARVVEKRALVNSLVGYPVGMEFFSTPELLEVGGHPLPTARYKPTREEAIDYYRGVAQAEGLDVRLYERVLSAEGDDEAFRVVTTEGVHPCRKVVVRPASTTSRKSSACRVRSCPTSRTTTASRTPLRAGAWR